MTDDTELREAMRTVRGTWRVWLLLLATLLIAGWGMQQLYHDRGAALADLAKSDAKATEKQAEVVALEQAKAEVEKEAKRLDEENKALVPIKERAEAEAKAKEARGASLDALKAAISEKWKDDLAKGVKIAVATGGEKLVIEGADKAVFDAADAVVLSKHGAEAVVALALAVQEAKAVRVRVVVHGDWVPVPAGDKTKGQVHDRALALARGLFEKLKGVEVDVSTPVAKNDRRRVEIEVELSS